MAVVKAFRVAQILQKQVNDTRWELHLFDDNPSRIFLTYPEAEKWVREPKNYQKEWTIIEVFVDDKYLHS